MAKQTELMYILAEKRDLFLACERATEEMCICPTEEMETYTAQRQEHLERARAIDDRIKVLSEGDETLQAALRNTCDRGGLPAHLSVVYDTALAVKAVANRILQNEEIVRQRIELEKERLLDKIYDINVSSSATAARYEKFVSLGVSQPKITFQDKKI